MSAPQLLGVFEDARRQLVGRAAGAVTRSVYLNLVFKAYYLTTTRQFALAYFFLIVLGIAERLFSFCIDCIRDKPGQPWRIFPRACIYYVVTLIRYVLMMAIMNGYVPMLLITCLGLALGQIIVEGIRYVLLARRASRRSKAATPDGDGDSTSSAKDSVDAAGDHHLRSNHIGESCC
ncbi:hypothetical protein H4R18_003255 [Coemansia javaensis]|uniref:Copper transporter n=1 Tax=Coemansia javaensis TaxID=2761396 RepID=A0A9W8H7H9_9FUNG|nr:hypothetical protein H4R18_003255 [Coemansia javaensis]